MPLTKQAIKKMHHDKGVTRRNKTVRENVQKALKLMRKTPSKKQLTAVFSVLDKAAKNNIVHKNKASRLKARLAKLLVK